jgi:hypothetical protein
MLQKSPVRLVEAPEAALKAKTRRDNGTPANTADTSVGGDAKDAKPDERA